MSLISCLMRDNTTTHHRKGSPELDARSDLGLDHRALIHLWSAIVTLMGEKMHCFS